jgi:hypothetical protein
VIASRQADVKVASSFCPPVVLQDTMVMVIKPVFGTVVSLLFDVPDMVITLAVRTHHAIWACLPTLD